MPRIRSLKEPKYFRYPRVYFSPIRDFTGHVPIRIIYPDGTPPQRPHCTFHTFERSPKGEGFEPCWYQKGMSPDQQVLALKNYCRDNGVELDFLGELK